MQTTWNNGLLEKWNNGQKLLTTVFGLGTQYSSIPSSHHSRRTTWRFSTGCERSELSFYLRVNPFAERKGRLRNQTAFASFMM